MKFSGEIEKTDNGVVIRPLYSSDQEALAKLKQNTQYKFEVKQPRNPKFHRLLLALFNLGYENQEKVDSFEHYRKLVVIKAGYYEAIILGDKTIYLADSISYEAKDQIEIEEVFNKCVDVVAEQLDSAPLLIKEQLEEFYGN